MLYIIVYEIKDAQRETQFLTRLKTLGQSVIFLPRAYFLDSQSDKNSVYESLKSVMKSEDLILISESSLSEMAGWLPNSAISWIRGRQ